VLHTNETSCAAYKARWKVRHDWHGEKRFETQTRESSAIALQPMQGIPAYVENGPDLE
jgi:hypothetical protein